MTVLAGLGQWYRARHQRRTAAYNAATKKLDTNLGSGAATTKSALELERDRLRNEVRQLQHLVYDLEGAQADSSQTAQRRNEQINELRCALTDLLGRFTHHGHPGVSSVRTGWVRTTYIDAIRARLERGEL